MDSFNTTVDLYNKYQAERDNQKIVELLKSFLMTTTEIDDLSACWALWNISDNLAILRNAEEYKLALQCNKLIEPFALKYGKYYESKIQSARKNSLLI